MSEIDKKIAKCEKGIEKALNFEFQNNELIVEGLSLLIEKLNIKKERTINKTKRKIKKWNQDFLINSKPKKSIYNMVEQF